MESPILSRPYVFPEITSDPLLGAVHCSCGCPLVAPGCMMTAPTPVGYAGNVFGHWMYPFGVWLHPLEPGNVMARSWLS